MATNKVIAVELPPKFEAVQFDGSIESAVEVEDWFKYNNRIDAGIRFFLSHGKLIGEIVKWSEYVREGDWVVNKNGRPILYSNEQFEELFDITQAVERARTA